MSAMSMDMFRVTNVVVNTEVRHHSVENIEKHGWKPTYVYQSLQIYSEGVEVLELTLFLDDSVDSALVKSTFAANVNNTESFAILW